MFQYSDGSQYDGKLINGKRNGPGVFISRDGNWTQSEWKDDHNQAGISSLADLKFIALLVGMSNIGNSEYALGVMSAFLKEKAAQKPFEYKKVSEALASVKNDLLSFDSNALAQAIKTDLEAGKSRLILYGFRGHAMGLEIVPENPNFFYFNLFNSGIGLSQFHLHLQNKPRHYQTMLRVQVPKKQVNLQLIEKLANRNKFKSINDTYNSITQLAGAQVIRIPNNLAIWQSSQKSANCSVEWIFAYLKNTLREPHYTEMRVELLEKTLKAVQKSSWPKNIDPDKHQVILGNPGIGYKKYTAREAKKVLIAELKRKLTKKENKLKTLQEKRCQKEKGVKRCQA